MNLSTISKPMRPVAEGVYPWPCSEYPDRTLRVYPDDVFTRVSPGVYTKHSGLMMVGVHIPDADMEPWPTAPVVLEIN